MVSDPGSFESLAVKPSASPSRAAANHLSRTHRISSEGSTRSSLERWPVSVYISSADLSSCSRVHAIVPPLSLCGPVLNVRKFSSIPLRSGGPVPETESWCSSSSPRSSPGGGPLLADWAHSVPIPDGNTASDLLRSRLAEMHVVLVAVPVPAPGPADRRERTEHHVPLVDHALEVAAPVGIRLGRPVADEAVAGDVGVLQRVDIDREPVGVLREVATGTKRRDDRAAVERCGHAAVAVDAPVLRERLRVERGGERD